MMRIERGNPSARAQETGLRRQKQTQQRGAPGRRLRLADAGVVGCCRDGTPAPDVTRRIAGQATVPPTVSPQAASANPPGRPRIGLVLGGGGAKGAAHVGVIRVLEEMRIPVDCIVGTSMGAVVGGTYATGMDAVELQRRIEDISWNDTIAFQNRHERLPMRRKLAGVTYSNSLEFGIHDDGLTAPNGFINTQNIEQTIRLLVSRSLGVQDFDRLPIPYRAVATDMQRGEMVVLDSGDLATALRASMAVPGIFAPVTIGDRVLGDGGLTRNVPVDIARQTCADVVIAVSVPNPIPKPEDLQSPLTMLNRTLDVLVGANERDQLRTLSDRDVSIVVDSGDITSGSFNRIKDAIHWGVPPRCSIARSWRATRSANRNTPHGGRARGATRVTASSSPASRSTVSSVSTKRTCAPSSTSMPAASSISVC
jgi:NTE family protein